MTEISKTSHGLKGLMAPDPVSTEVDIHQDGVTMVKSLCYFCHANCGVLAYVKDGDVIKIEGDPDYSRPRRPHRRYPGVKGGLSGMSGADSPAGRRAHG